MLGHSVYNRAMSSKTAILTKNASTISEMFDRIADRYDFLNHLLSFGLDIRWRKKVARLLPNKKKLKLLDIATGTGDQVFLLCKGKTGKRISSAVGIDISKRMIQLGRRKMLKKKLTKKIQFEIGDVMNLDFPDHHFDVATVSFGIRNVENVTKALSEIYRVLTPNGKLIILEFSIPRNAFVRWAYLKYFRNVLPKIGAWFSGDSKAYTYLNKSVESFDSPEKFCQRLELAGFERTQHKSLCLGIAALVQGTKNDENNI